MEKTNRREFVQAVAGKAVAGTALAGGVPAISLTMAADAAAGPQPAQRDRRRDVARLLADIVRVQHCDRLDAAQMQLVQERIAGAIATAESLKRLPLSNSDEPDFVFFADEP